MLTKEVDTDDSPEILYQSEYPIWPRSWSPDGQWLAVIEGSANTGANLYAVNVDDWADRITIATTPNIERLVRALAPHDPYLRGTPPRTPVRVVRRHHPTGAQLHPHNRSRRYRHSG